MTFFEPAQLVICLPGLTVPLNHDRILSHSLNPLRAAQAGLDVIGVVVEEVVKWPIGGARWNLRTCQRGDLNNQDISTCFRKMHGYGIEMHWKYPAQAEQHRLTNVLFPLHRFRCSIVSIRRTHGADGEADVFGRLISSLLCCQLPALILALLLLRRCAILRDLPWLRCSSYFEDP